MRSCTSGMGWLDSHAMDIKHDGSERMVHIQISWFHPCFANSVAHHAGLEERRICLPLLCPYYDQMLWISQLVSLQQ